MIRLTQEREARKWSRAALARKVWMNGVTVGQIESGRLKPYLSQLIRLAQALDWKGNPWDLMDEVDSDE